MVVLHRKVKPLRPRLFSLASEITLTELMRHVLFTLASVANPESVLGVGAAFDATPPEVHPPAAAAEVLAGDVLHVDTSMVGGHYVSCDGSAVRRLLTEAGQCLGVVEGPKRQTHADHLAQHMLVSRTISRSFSPNAASCIRPFAM